MGIFVDGPIGPDHHESDLGSHKYIAMDILSDLESIFQFWVINKVVVEGEDHVPILGLDDLAQSVPGGDPDSSPGVA